MAMDLNLLPMKEYGNCSHTILPLRTNSRVLFAKIRGIKNDSNTQIYIEGLHDNGRMSPDTGEVEKGFTCFLAYDGATEERCYGEVTEDQYGKKLQWVTAGALCKVFKCDDTEGLTLDNSFAPNKATWAFIKALPHDVKIVVYWC